MSGENQKQLSLVPAPAPAPAAPAEGHEGRAPPAAQQEAQVYPGTLQGVLNWTVEQAGEHISRVAQESASHAAGDGGAPHVLAMDPERRRFLDAVFKQFTQDPFDGVKKSIAQLKSKDATTETRIEALEAIQDEVEDLNIAEVLHSAGGFVQIVSFLNPGADPELQWRSADIIASMSQNFPKAQDLVTPFKVVPRLVALLSAEHSEQVRAKALRALSCLARGHEELTKQCLEEPSFMTLVCDCIDSGDVHLQVKASHLLRHFFESRALAESCSPAIRSLVGSLQVQPHDSLLWEHAVGALAEASSDHPSNTQLIRTDYAVLRDILHSRVAYIKTQNAEDQAAHVEELEYVEKLQHLFV